MSNIETIENFIKNNIEKYDFEIVSKMSVGGKALFRASIDNVEGGNFVTSGWEYSLDEAFKELVNELEKQIKEFKVSEKLTGKPT